MQKKWQESQKEKFKHLAITPDKRAEWAENAANARSRELGEDVSKASDQVKGELSKPADSSKEKAADLMHDLEYSAKNREAMLNAKSDEMKQQAKKMGAHAESKIGSVVKTSREKIHDAVESAMSYMPGIQPKE